MLGNRSFKIIGHRGAAGLRFENTLTAILEAIKVGVDAIEIDVWDTIDGEIVVFHDAYLNRLTPENGFINETTYEKLGSIKLNSGDKIPKLKEVIEIVQKHKLQLLVEVKSEKAFARTLEILLEKLSYSDFIIGSFFHRGIMEIKRQNPLVQSAIMFESVPIDLDEYLLKVNPDFVIVSIETYNQY